MIKNTYFKISFLFLYIVFDAQYSHVWGSSSWYEDILSSYDALLSSCNSRQRYAEDLSIKRPRSIEDLPLNILKKIVFEYLDIKEALRITTVSKTFSRARAAGELHVNFSFESLAELDACLESVKHVSSINLYNFYDRRFIYEAPHANPRDFRFKIIDYLKNRWKIMNIRIDMWRYFWKINTRDSLKDLGELSTENICLPGLRLCFDESIYTISDIRHSLSNNHHSQKEYDFGLLMSSIPEGAILRFDGDMNSVECLEAFVNSIMRSYTSQPLRPVDRSKDKKKTGEAGGPIVPIRKPIRLDLYNKKINAEGAQVLKILLKYNLVDYLDLQSNHLGFDGGIHISNALMANNTLRKLILSSNSLGNNWATKFSKCLEQNKTLEHLVVVHVGLNKIGAAVIMHGILRHPRLETFWLSWSHKRDREAIIPDCTATVVAYALADVLETNTSLKKIGIFCSNYKQTINSRFAEIIAPALARNQHLVELIMPVNAITDRGCMTLAETLKHNQLKNLDMTYNETTSYGRVQVDRMLKQFGKNKNICFSIY